MIQQIIMENKYCMNEIINLNCSNLCSEQYCSNEYSFYLKLKINGLVCFIGFCSEHSNIIEGLK